MAKVFFCPLGKKRAFYAILLFFRSFWFSVVTSVTLKNPRIPKKRIEKNPKSPIISKNLKQAPKKFKLKLNKITTKIENCHNVTKKYLTKKKKKCYSLSFAN